MTIWGAMLGWSVALFAIVRSDYHEFRLARFDLGNMVQAVWSTTQGRPLEVTDATGEQIVRLAGHVDPILVLLAPLWAVFPSPLTLAAVQIGACALGALPVFWLGRRHLRSERAAGLLSLAYLAYPWLAWSALEAMHPVTLSIPLFLFAIYFLDSDRIRPFAVCGLLILATGELMGVSLAALGLWYWLSRGKRRAGLAIAVSGLAWSAVAVKLVVPAFRGEPSPFNGLYESIGGSPEGVLRTAVTDPLSIVSALTTSNDVEYVLWLAAPLAGIFLLAPGLAAVALPQLLANTLADRATPVDPRTHYVGPMIAFLLAAAVFGTSRVAESHRIRVAALVLGSATAVSLLVGPWPWTPIQGMNPSRESRPASSTEALRAAVSLVPPDVAVSATNVAGSHLSERRYVYQVPVFDRADWIVVDLTDATPPVIRVAHYSTAREFLRRFVTRVDATPGWRRVFDREEVVVFRRNAVGSSPS